MGIVKDGRNFKQTWLKWWIS